ncbi:MAG: hypothetical protein ACRDRJ_41020 [Streptosporangiaceae bacterium]
MRSIEDSLRGAFREIADEVPADSVPPLILPARRRRTWLTRQPAPPAAGRARTWAAVTSSAVMVAVVVGAAASLGSVLHAHRSGDDLSALGAPAASAARLASAVPRYYVALTVAAGLGRVKSRPRASAVVRSTATGATIATVRPPRPYDTFTMVTAARDDRTFVLVAERFPAAPAERLFVLHLHPARRAPASRAQLAALPVSDLAKGTQTWDLALSPDGRQLAAAVGPDFPRELQVVDLATGAQHAWAGSPQCLGCAVTGYGTAGGNGWLSWSTDGRTLAVAGAGSVRLLNTAAPGADLMADSRPVSEAVIKALPDWREVVLTPDEQALVAVRQITTKGRGDGVGTSQELVRLSATTGRPTAVLNELPVRQGSFEQVLWTSASGQTLIVTGTDGGASAGVLQDHHYTPIPWTPGVLSAAW